ncbi:MAG: RsmD family RNA methyltransferase, partial [Candidatus Stygibacter australis]|nr:RsmD family RNA methyltransferase [Candidatus Stygibacter australis]
PFIKKCEEQFDMIFLDPPYNKKLINSTIEEIFAADLLGDNGIVIAEHSSDEVLDEKWTDHIIQIKKTRHSQVSIISKNTNIL